jgi:hypothetical protein
MMEWLSQVTALDAQWIQEHPQAFEIILVVIQAGGRTTLTPKGLGMSRYRFFEVMKDLRSVLQVSRGQHGNDVWISDISPDISTLDKQRTETLKQGTLSDISSDISNTQSDISSAQNSDISISDKQRTERLNQANPSDISNSENSDILHNIFNKVTVDGDVNGAAATVTATAEQGQLQFSGATPTAVEKSPQKKAAEKKKISDAFFLREFNEKFWPGILKKKGKDSAINAYLRIRRSKRTDLSAEELQKRYNQHYNQASDPKYAKHPSSWLNAGCFDDEPDPVQEQVQEQQQRVTEMTSRWVQSA